MSHDREIRDINRSISSEARATSYRFESVERDMRLNRHKIGDIELKINEINSEIEDIKQYIHNPEQGIYRRLIALENRTDKLTERTPKTIKDELKEYAFKEFGEDDS